MSRGNLAEDLKENARRHLSLDGVWQFRHENGPWRDAHVPSPWQAEFPDLVDTFGTAIYRRNFVLPDDWSQKELAIHFGAVSYACDVHFNGVKIGDHEGTFLPFEIIIPTDLIRQENEQENEIEVRVVVPSADHRAYPDFPFDEVPHGKISWYGRIGGLWQSVYLEARDPRRISHTTIEAGADGQMKAILCFSDAAAGLDATASVIDAAGQVVATGAFSAAAEVTLNLSVENPKLWSPDTPNLYTLHLDLDGGTDVVTQSFGFRTIETRDGNFYLNGAPIYLRGALDQDYYPEGIYSPPSLEFLEDQARKAKELGLNLLRCHIKVPDPRYYEVADRLGLLIWTEIPNVALFTDRSADRMVETMRGILARDRNHPSIIAWTIINEDWGTRLVENAEHRDWLKQTFDWLKQEDTTRLVVDNSACFPNFHVKSDINDFHYYRTVPERRQEWDDITAQFATGADWTYSSLGDAERRGDEPLVVSEFGVWGLPNPKKLRDTDGKEPAWFETGALWGDGVALPHGIEERYASLDLDRTFGSFDSFIEAIQWYQYMNLRYEIETMRLHPSIVGYVITELTDVHWEANGLMDIERNPRVFHDVFAEINTDLVIIPRPERYAAFSGTALPITITVATGTLGLKESARLVWSGDAAGTLDIPAIDPMSTTELPETNFTLPETSVSRMAKIDFQIEVDGEVIARNNCEIALFPTRAASQLPTISTTDETIKRFSQGLGYTLTSPEEADIHLCHAVDSDDVEIMKAGGCYVIFGDGTVSTNENLRTDMPEGEAPHRDIIADGKKFRPSLDQHLPGISLAERDGTIWRGDWISSFSWVRRDGAFAALPGGPVIDLSFSDVVPHHVLTGFRPWEFGSNVHAGLVVGWVHKPATLIGEKRVGRGGVIATTFRLFNQSAGTDPVAATLFDALIATAGEMPIDKP